MALSIDPAYDRPMTAIEDALAAIGGPLTDDETQAAWLAGLEALDEGTDVPLAVRRAVNRERRRFRNPVATASLDAELSSGGATLHNLVATTATNVESSVLGSDDAGLPLGKLLDLFPAGQAALLSRLTAGDATAKTNASERYKIRTQARGADGVYGSTIAEVGMTVGMVARLANVHDVETLSLLGALVGLAQRHPVEYRRLRDHERSVVIGRGTKPARIVEIAAQVCGTSAHLLRERRGDGKRSSGAVARGRAVVRHALATYTKLTWAEIGELTGVTGKTAYAMEHHKSYGWDVKVAHDRLLAEAWDKVHKAILRANPDIQPVEFKCGKCGAPVQRDNRSGQCQDCQRKAPRQ